MKNKNTRAKLFFTIIISGFAFFISNRAMVVYSSLDGEPIQKLLDTLNSLMTEVSKHPLKLGLDKNSLIAGAIGCLIPLLVYLYTLSGRNNYLVGMEHGSAKWGTSTDIASYTDKINTKNMLFTKTERMSLDTRKTFRNNNVLIIGGSGSGKTRFYVKPNLMQLHSSYVITDPNKREHAMTSYE